MSTAIFVILLCVAVFGTLIVGAFTGEFHKGDAFGRGLMQAYTMGIDVVLLIDLAVLFLMTGSRGGFPNFWGLIASCILIFTAIAQFSTILALTDIKEGTRFETQLRILAAAAPAVLIAFCVVHFFSKPPTAVSALLAVLPLAISGVSTPLLIRARAESAAAVAEASRVYQEERARDQVRIAEVNALPADVPVSKLLTYTEGPVRGQNDTRQAALWRIRNHPDRDAQVQAALASGNAQALIYIDYIDPAVTPELCEAARACARNYYVQLHPTAEFPTFKSATDHFEYLGVHLRWLREHGCDCKPEIVVLQKVIERYPGGKDSPYLQYLSGLLNGN